MVNIKIDGKAIAAREGQTILEAAREAGIRIPTLCYFKDLNEVGACRVCVVEIVGQQKLSASCNTQVAEGMEILTGSERVRAARRTDLELILANHETNCTACVRSENCELRALAAEMNLLEVPFEAKPEKKNWDKTLPLQRDASKCIQCMRCVNVCDKLQGLGVWAQNGSGAHAKITVRGGLSLNEAGCAFCGQCITHCPTGALTARDDTAKAFKALAGDKVTVVQIAPAVRAAWGDALGLAPALATEKRMAAAAKALGADYVFDTNFTADLTIMEEGSEFIERLTKGDRSVLPMFTSCCPGWVRFVKHEYPELCGHLSTAKSPQQMFGAVAKSYFAEKIGKDPADIFCISVMPCSSKKYECDVKELNAASDKDVDLVLTTREFGRMIKAAGIDAAALPERDFDSPLGTGSGAAVIFGATGGVMEAALRSAHFLITGKNPDADAFRVVRGTENSGIRAAEIEIGGAKVRAAVASGLANARILCEEVRSGKAPYDFIEIMACPGGCAGGGGQPIVPGEEPAAERGSRLYELDAANTLRFSHENPEVQALYRDYLEKPLSHRAHELLHTEQSEWTL